MIPLFFTLSYFNSHAHVERDDGFIEKVYYICISTHMLTWSVTSFLLRSTSMKLISTHTLTWSVTPALLHLYLRVLHFNSHAHVERDDLINSGKIQYNHFNSHAHVERDQKFHTVIRRSSHFNSHAHVERDKP